MTKYNDIIQDQIDQRIMEKVKSPTDSAKKELFIPDKLVVRETAESSKVRIVYDASAKASDKAPSLHDCLETGPPLQNHLWSVLTRNRFYPIAVAGDLRQAFPQVQVREED